MICNNNYLADILRVGEIKNLICVMFSKSLSIVKKITKGNADLVESVNCICVNPCLLLGQFYV